MTNERNGEQHFTAEDAEYAEVRADKAAACREIIGMPEHPIQKFCMEFVAAEASPAALPQRQLGALRVLGGEMLLLFDGRREHARRPGDMTTG